MATHKVPQNVEAEDKLVGFLSLKQFIFTILGIGFGYLTFFFFTKVHPISAIIWIPPTLVFFVLGLYQRKDQPVEVFLASALRFYLKPRTRVWSLEGYQERVVITAPPKIEHHYTKNFTGEEATSRLGSLSRLMDSRGWAAKMASDWQNPQLATAAASDRLVQPGDLNVSSGVDPATYMQPVDVQDANASLVAKDFQSRINQTDTSTKQHALETLQQARASQNDDDPSSDAGIQSTVDDSSNNTQTTTAPHVQKYPQMHQKVVSTDPDPGTEQSESETDVVRPQTAADFVRERPVDSPSQPPTQPMSQETEDGSVEIKLH